MPPGPVPASRSVPCGSPGRQLWPVGLFCSPWPEQALRANIHCQISLALNRIYTEWYPSKGYSFNITNSTSYDQYYVHGRTVFDVMVRLTDDIFNTYIRKTGTVNPYYAEYCDGKSVTCPGLKQWGTVTLANQGRNALSILKYYYGNNIEIIRTNNIQSIPQSYPGSPLRQGSTGAAVFTLQRQLNRITKDYPFLGLLTVDGIFGRKMTEAVKKFQKQFNSPPTAWWAAAAPGIRSAISMSVKDLAELTSEGDIVQHPPGQLYGTSAASSNRLHRRRGRADAVLAEYVARESSILCHGGRRLRRAAQRRLSGVPAALHGLTVDGIVGLTMDRAVRPVPQHPVRTTYPNAYPITALRQGSSGGSVPAGAVLAEDRTTVYSSLNKHHRGRHVFGSSTAAADAAVPDLLSASTSDGVVGPDDMAGFSHEVYNDITTACFRPACGPASTRACCAMAPPAPPSESCNSTSTS